MFLRPEWTKVFKYLQETIKEYDEISSLNYEIKDEKERRL